MAGLQEGVNEIKTALDDWITTIKDYNTYRGSLGVTIMAGFMGDKYPAKIAYYEGEIKTLDIDSLNPNKTGGKLPENKYRGSQGFFAPGSTQVNVICAGFPPAAKTAYPDQSRESPEFFPDQRKNTKDIDLT